MIACFVRRLINALSFFRYPVDIFSKGIMACKQAFYRMESDCLDKVPVIGLVVCLPFKMSFICELLRRMYSFIVKHRFTEMEHLQAINQI